LASRGASLRELDQAESLAGQLTSALGAREQGPVIAADVATQRQRNFTLFAQSYDQVRRAISYLRWDNDDVDNIAPSLYGGRVVSRKKPDPQPSPTPPVPAPAPGQPGAMGSAAPAAAPNTAATASSHVIAPGLPGGSPFAAGN
jgi:hypothetical protein